MEAKRERQTYLDGWRLFPWSCLGHHALGAVCGILVATGEVHLMAAGIVTMALYVAYQGLSVIRKKDSAGLDAADALYGFLPATLVLEAVRLAAQLLTVL